MYCWCGSEEMGAEVAVCIVGVVFFREPEGTKVFGTNHFISALDDADEVKMDVQKGSISKYTSGALSSASLPISVASSKPPSSNMQSISVLSTKTPSFA